GARTCGSFDFGSRPAISRSISVGFPGSVCYDWRLVKSFTSWPWEVGRQHIFCYGYYSDVSDRGWLRGEVLFASGAGRTGIWADFALAGEHSHRAGIGVAELRWDQGQRAGCAESCFVEG